jgi:hypothetical protein
MRRRMGAPSSHLESAGKNMARNNMTPEEVIASAEHKNSARRYVGQSTGGFEAVKPERGTLIAKKNTQAADPTSGGKANKKNILVNNSAASERMGAKYRITASYPTVAPEAGPTMRNARTIPSVMGKQSPNFNDGMGSSY